ncbi:MAG: DUF5103 domain-containing protein [Bacteroidota bacterium]
MIKTICLIFILIIYYLSVSTLFCQTSGEESEYVNDDFLRYNNHVYKDSIYTIQLHKEGWELTYPVINLDSEDRLLLSFDDLNPEIKNYYYTFVHCNTIWEPSGLMTNEFLEGFAENQINDYSFSFNTTIKYVHYSVVFPNDDVKFVYSGNYIVMVYEDFNQEKLVFTRRFSVVEQLAQIDAVIKQASQLDLRKSSQEIDFTIKHSGLQIDDPYNDIKVVICQNNRWDNAVKDIKPLLIKNNELYYDYDQENVFEAGSEFRNFDIKSIRYQTQYIQEIVFKEPFYHVRLLSDDYRRFKIFFHDKDINGRYFIKIDDRDDSNVEADYVYVYFTLPFDAPVIDGNIYVFGALSNWNFNSKNQMFYNYEEKAYQLKLLIKQGYYNYEYVYVKDGSEYADHTYIEGSHYETENDYIIYIYYKNIRSRYYRLVGYQIINSQIN